MKSREFCLTEFRIKGEGKIGVENDYYEPIRLKVIFQKMFYRRV